jgi:hypothetical protein
VLRGDIARLERCTAITTGGSGGAGCGGKDTVKRSKPFKYAYEKEIVMLVDLFSFAASVFSGFILTLCYTLVFHIGMPISR